MQFPWGPTQTWGGHLQEAPALKAHSPSLEPSEGWLRLHCPAKGQAWLLAPRPLSFGTHLCLSVSLTESTPIRGKRSTPHQPSPPPATPPIHLVFVSLWLGLSVAAGDNVGVQLQGQALPPVPPEPLLSHLFQSHLP